MTPLSALPLPAHRYGYGCCRYRSDRHGDGRGSRLDSRLHQVRCDSVIGRFRLRHRFRCDWCNWCRRDWKLSVQCGHGDVLGDAVEPPIPADELVAINMWGVRGRRPVTILDFLFLQLSAVRPDERDGESHLLESRLVGRVAPSACWLHGDECGIA